MRMAKNKLLSFTASELLMSELSLCGLLSMSLEETYFKEWENNFKIIRTLNFLRKLVRTSKKKDFRIVDLQFLLSSEIELNGENKRFVDHLKNTDDYNKINSIFLKIIDSKKNRN